MHRYEGFRVSINMTQISDCHASPVLLSAGLASTHHRVSRSSPSKLISVSCRASSSDGAAPAGFYKMLCLSSNNAGIQEIKRAYRSMALKYHPDVCDIADKEASARVFVQLHVAYRTLSDPLAREEYDLRLRQFGESATGYHEMDQLGGRRRWKDQLVELKRRSSHRETRDGGSWGSRMRARNKEN
ncbi:chaperone protein dnaJ 20, chloroplastic-like [Diospyros lotus]|uniref:chaperone protein dnaJ 20, chloroplastic-like n=1 Tax=Diospyros lotus TaxID=55363 RepID=UPI002254D797|nr:chaperone protein dnaJ 20, chloroplastic-like [Diospyros lotus]